MKISAQSLRINKNGPISKLEEVAYSKIDSLGLEQSVHMNVCGVRVSRGI